MGERDTASFDELVRQDYWIVCLRGESMQWIPRALLFTLVLHAPFPCYAQGVVGRANDTYGFYRTYVQKPGKVVELFATIESGFAGHGARDYQDLSNSYLERTLGVKGAEQADNFLVGPVEEVGRSSQYYVQLSGLTKKECVSLARHAANQLFSAVIVNGTGVGESACGGNPIRDWFFSGTNVVRFISR